MEKKNMIWGKYTWMLFHTLAEKIKEEEFENEKETLISFIKRLCGVLPCSDCAMHATYTLNHYKYHFIKTKDDFKKFLFEFHNLVNKRKEYQNQTISILEQYEKAILYKIVHVWNTTFVVSGMNSRLLTDSMHRNKIKKEFLKYMQFNKHKFNN
tara:strand:- start:1484 stop:1945 length:462 start_codon:yes stop_codon:yes gene_type:complete